MSGGREYFVASDGSFRRLAPKSGDVELRAA
jgi:hypothetical protein